MYLIEGDVSQMNAEKMADAARKIVGSSYIRRFTLAEDSFPLPEGLDENQAKNMRAVREGAVCGVSDFATELLDPQKTYCQSVTLSKSYILGVGPQFAAVFSPSADFDAKGGRGPFDLSLRRDDRHFVFDVTDGAGKACGSVTVPLSFVKEYTRSLAAFVKNYEGVKDARLLRAFDDERRDQHTDAARRLNELYFNLQGFHLGMWYGYTLMKVMTSLTDSFDCAPKAPSPAVPKTAFPETPKCGS